MTQLLVLGNGAGLANYGENSSNYNLPSLQCISVPLQQVAAVSNNWLQSEKQNAFCCELALGIGEREVPLFIVKEIENRNKVNPGRMWVGNTETKDDDIETERECINSNNGYALSLGQREEKEMTGKNAREQKELSVMSIPRMHIFQDQSLHHTKIGDSNGSSGGRGMQVNVNVNVNVNGSTNQSGGDIANIPSSSSSSSLVFPCLVNDTLLSYPQSLWYCVPNLPPRPVSYVLAATATPKTQEANEWTNSSSQQNQLPFLEPALVSSLPPLPPLMTATTTTTTTPMTRTRRIQKSVKNSSIPDALQHLDEPNCESSTGSMSIAATSAALLSDTHPLVKRRCDNSEKNFECKKCGKRYKYETNLITHGKVHTEQALECEYCHK
ncbi:zinc finger protein, partial [Reticulomyxa filosa]